MFKLFKKKVVKNEVRLDFEKFVAECEEHDKKMHDLTFELLCDNAYVCGKAGISVDFEKYKGRYDNIEVLLIKANWQQGDLELKMNRMG